MAGKIDPRHEGGEENHGSLRERERESVCVEQHDEFQYKCNMID